MKKLVSMLLAISCLFMVTGCKSEKNSGTQGGGNENAKDTITPVNFDYVEGTTHIFNATETSDYLIKNGKSDYKILVPNGYKEDSYLSRAATELQNYLVESTKARLEIVEEANFVENQKYISLGDTNFADSEGVYYDINVLGTQGYTIKTVDKNVFISGATGFAILWGVYGLLEYECGYDYFYSGVYALEQHDSITLKIYDFTDVPDIETRITNYGSSTYTGAYSKMRYVLESDVVIWGTHSSLNVLPYSEYAPEHPDWYINTQNQLCYSAHGNAEELEALIETVSTLAFEEMQKYPTKNLINFSDADNFDYCNCDVCSENTAKYGARSSNPLLFSKALAENLKQKLVAAGDRRAETFKIMFFSYNRTETAPVVTTIDPITGKMSFEYAEELISENVMAYYAPIGSVFEVPILDNINTGLYKNLFAWGQLCNVGLYGYDLMTQDFLFPNDLTDSLPELFKACRMANVEYSMIQGQTYAVASTGWCYLKNYMTSKLGWNVNADPQELIAKFFKGMYGSQASRMQKVYEDYHALAELQTTVWNCPKGIGASLLNKTYWPESLLLEWINEMLDIEKTLLDNDESIIYAQNVRAELLSYLYLYIELYEDNAQPALIHEYAQKFVSIVSELGFSWSTEAASITELVNKYSQK